MSTSAYADDCYFADPTVAFSGLARWQKNLVLLVPFLIQPRIDLESLRQTSDSTLQVGAPDCQPAGEASTSGRHGAFEWHTQAVNPWRLSMIRGSILVDMRYTRPVRAVQASWHLTTTLKLPWRPLIDLHGATDYFLNEQGDRVRASAFRHATVLPGRCPIICVHQHKLRIASHCTSSSSMATGLSSQPEALPPAGVQTHRELEHLWAAGNRPDAAAWPTTAA